MRTKKINCIHCKTDNLAKDNQCFNCGKNQLHIPVNLTEKQKDELHKLWWVYGNNAKKHTPMSHYWIQRFLDSNENHFLCYGTVKGNNGISDECLEAVHKVIGDKNIVRFNHENFRSGSRKKSS